ncbi:hypothetical protein [Rhizobium ruizarguesonis]|uniref:hypothetical protein n=1 Tax=Rhizobium ruizarguesonis TaxID=2081791 RepID=UPI001031D52C|nr:hypothetical protein [Rhizobium ruizarguesonis]TAT71063.1 hypothetical protein ELI52_36475 [Rhizobium ruizarguesonis]
MEAWRVLIPVAWIVVSTIVGLVLYRSSKAFFTQKDPQNSRQIRLTGSVVIAALAFIALWKTTPNEMLVGMSEGKRLIAQDEISRAIRSTEQVVATFDRLVVCRKLSDLNQCDIDLERVKNALTVSVSDIHALSEPK